MRRRMAVDMKVHTSVSLIISREMLLSPAPPVERNSFLGPREFRHRRAPHRPISASLVHLLARVATSAAKAAVARIAAKLMARAAAW